MKEVLAAKDRHRQTLIEYLTNPDNPYLTRSKLSTDVLGFSSQSVIYTHFSPDELAEIEHEALELRRSCYAAKLAQVDQGLLDSAIKSGGAAEAKLVYERFEGWNPKKMSEVTFTGPILQQLFAVLPPEIAEKVKLALISQQKELT
jgi:hypothetical protein